MKNQVEGKSYRDEYEAYLPDLLSSPRAFRVLEPMPEWQNAELCYR